MQNMSIERMLNQNVEVFTSEGLLYRGKLVGVDQALNVVLESAALLGAQPETILEKKTHILRGDTVCAISLAK